MNWDKIEQLLGIVEKARQWPPLKPIHDAAMAELVAMATPKVEPPQQAPSARVYPRDTVMEQPSVTRRT